MLGSSEANSRNPFLNYLEQGTYLLETSVSQAIDHRNVFTLSILQTDFHLPLTLSHFSCWCETGLSPVLLNFINGPCLHLQSGSIALSLCGCCRGAGERTLPSDYVSAFYEPVIDTLGISPAVIWGAGLVWRSGQLRNK